ncbi:MAG: pyridoxamine 5'-phosphate oxidase family protein [Leptolyngbyaceae bacterium]|nr:pyridoxamine 5'-phosphate oxidase family protein [Leptolyngbyaceae bacterium]
MANFYPELTDDFKQFISEQHMFFIASAPIEGRVNLSPKGIDTFRCFDNKTVGYLDLTGSGNETAAHLHENGRITIMFCSFTKKPLILRLYGQGRMIQPRHPDWNLFYQEFEPVSGNRQIMVMEIESLQTSCGYGVPMFEFQQQRDTLIKWAAKKGDSGLNEFQLEHNQQSIDGLQTRLLSD